MDESPSATSDLLIFSDGLLFSVTRVVDKSVNGRQLNYVATID